MRSVEIKKFNKGMCRIMAPSINDLEPIRKYFRTENPSKFYIEYHMAGAQAADWLYAISNVGIFKTGLLPSVLKVLKTLGIEYTVDVEIIKEFRPFKIKNINPEIFPLPFDDKFEERDYQYKAVKTYLDSGRGIVILPTASGKSYVVAKTLWSLLKSEPEKIKHCLIYVPNTSLVRQFYNDLLDYGIPKEYISKFCSDSKKSKELQDTPIIISNRQWLERHRDELPSIDVLFVDECVRKGQKITTEDGYKKIEDVIVGDRVLSFNIETSEYEYKPVIGIHENLPKSNSYTEYIQIHLEDDKKIEVTPNHKIYTTNRGYVRADQLNEKDDILLEDLSV